MASCGRLQEENLQLAKRLQELQTESQEQSAPQPDPSLACKPKLKMACFPQLRPFLEGYLACVRGVRGQD